MFEGLLTLGDPARSWVAKWQRLQDYLPGVYAVKVVGSLPGEVLTALEDAGINYVPYICPACDVIDTDSLQERWKRS